jgi:anthranilate phosphoribosyltransferase
LLGVGHAELQPLLAESLTLLGVRRALVVHGADGLDEVSLGGKTVVLEAADGNVRRFEWHPSDFGLQPAGRSEMLVSGPAESASIVRGILDGRRGPSRDIVLANAAAALWTVGRAATPTAGVARAAEAIDGGAARELLARLVERTNRT